MGLFDDIRDAIGDVDPSAEKMPKGFGFDPDVCEGCPYNTGGRVPTCSKCGCPVGSGMPMERLGMPPADCIRLDEHKDR